MKKYIIGISLTIFVWYAFIQITGAYMESAMRKNISIIHSKKSSTEIIMPRGTHFLPHILNYNHTYFYGKVTILQDNKIIYKSIIDSEKPHGKSYFFNKIAYSYLFMPIQLSNKLFKQNKKYKISIELNKGNVFLFLNLGWLDCLLCGGI